MKPFNLRRFAAGFLRVLPAVLWLPAAALAADPGTLSRAESLLAKPFADAAVVSRLASGARVEIVSRSGGWYQVKAAGKTGWVRMLSVRRSTTTTTSVAGLASVTSGRSGTGTVSTTTGVRGLDEQALAAAAFDEAQVARAETYRVNRADADAFAKAGKLVVRDVKPLPVPAKK